MAWNSLGGEDLHLLNERSRAVKPRRAGAITKEDAKTPIFNGPSHKDKLCLHGKSCQGQVTLPSKAKLDSPRCITKSAWAHASGWTLTLNYTKKTWLALRSQVTCSRACNQCCLPNAPALIPAPAVNTFPLKRPKPEVATDATRRGNPDKANIKQDNACYACTRQHCTAKEETSRVYC